MSRRGGIFLGRRGLGSRARKQPGGAAAAWDPSQITGVAEWWRADLGVTDAGAGAVSAWQGQIAGETLSQGTAAARPTLTTRDSQSVLSFDGGDWLQGAFGTITLSLPYDIVVIGQLSADSGFQVFVDGDDVTNRAILCRRIGTWQLFAGGFLAGPASSASEVALIGSVNASTTDSLVANDFTSPTTGNAANGVPDGLTVGGYFDGTNPLTGWVWEVILVDQAITAGDLALLGAYLDARYPGLTLTY